MNFAHICKQARTVFISAIMLTLYGSSLATFVCVICVAWALLIWAINFLPLILTATPSTAATYAAVNADIDVLFTAMFWPLVGLVAACCATFVTGLLSGALAVYAAWRVS